MSGNAKDVCVEQAKGKERVARAELDYKQDASERHRGKVESAKADAQYAVAKEKCDDLSGEKKDACVKDAKAAKARADADIRSARQSQMPGAGQSQGNQVARRTKKEAAPGRGRRDSRRREGRGAKGKLKRR